MAKHLLIVAHAPSPNTTALREALRRGAEGAGATDFTVDCRSPFDTRAADVRAASAVILATPENLGYMSGALKDFFDRIYNPCQEHTQGLAHALLIRAGQDGTGTRRAVETITTGLRWRSVHAPVICRGAWRDEFVAEAEGLGAFMAAGLDAGIF
ncbi:MAG: flavodoxin family protein [Alphaproteobacteria bacterium]|nr:flavodoxin family protein [Alphaproteobacteria bacterium]